MGYIKAAETTEIPAGKSKRIELEENTIAIFNVGGNFHAIQDTCNHMGAPLSDGNLKGCTVICPWHAAQFDVTSGKAVGGPARGDLRSYPIKIEGDEIHVDVS